MNLRSNSVSILVLTAIASLDALAIDESHKKAAASVATTQSAATALTSGEVKKVDRDAGKITIKHGPLVNLDMPSMTMVFRVKDPAMLDQVQVGDKIGFVAEKLNGAYTVMKLETMQ